MSVINTMEAGELKSEMTEDARKLRKLIKTEEEIEDSMA